MSDINASVEKWKRNMLASPATIKAGVQAVTVSPTAKAADAADAYVAGVQNSVASGKFQASLRAVSLQAWQTATIDKMTQRLSKGVTDAVPKVQRFLAQLIPYTDNVKRTIAAMPKGGEANGDARVLAAIRMMRQFKYQRQTV